MPKKRRRPYHLPIPPELPIPEPEAQLDPDLVPVKIPPKFANLLPPDLADLAFGEVKNWKARPGTRTHARAPIADNPGSFRNWRIKALRRVSRTGGVARAILLSPARRAAIAKAAARARWNKAAS